MWEKTFKNAKLGFELTSYIDDKKKYLVFRKRCC